MKRHADYITTFNHEKRLRDDVSISWQILYNY